MVKNKSTGLTDTELVIKLFEKAYKFDYSGNRIKTMKEYNEKCQLESIISNLKNENF